MPYFMHQWSYTSAQVREIVTEQQNREDVIRVVTEAAGGTLHQFYFCLGAYDGVAVTEFPDMETALACLMVIFGAGSLRELQTTPLFLPAEGRLAIERAQSMTGP